MNDQPMLTDFEELWRVSEPMKNEMMDCYTDGAAWPNPGRGGWAFVIVDRRNDREVFRMAGAEEHTTNNRMEMQAAIEAMDWGRKRGVRLRILSDSTIVVNGANRPDGRHRRRRKGVVVPNQDLWSKIEGLQGDTIFMWIKGHAHSKWNDLADVLAESQVAAQTGFGPSGCRPAFQKKFLQEFGG